MVTRKNAPASTVVPPTLTKVHPPMEHLQILWQRFESLISSIVTLREEIAMIPGVDEWPALLNRYSTLLSHAYSISASLMSASPHFLPSQLSSFNKVLEAEARNANLYAGIEDASSALFSRLNRQAQDDHVKATADGLPELRFHDPNNQLPSLVAHPILPITEDKMNFLGALLRTAPELDITEEENKLIAHYDGSKHQDEAIEGEAKIQQEMKRVQEEISQHDILALRSLRTWYHVQQAPDEDGNVINLKDRIPRDEEEDEDEEMDEDEKESGEIAAEKKHKMKLRKEMQANTWSADSVSSFLHGQAQTSS